MADNNSLENGIQISDYAEYNYQRIFNANTTFDDISTFAGTLNDVSPIEFGVDFNNISTSNLDFINMVERSGINPGAMKTSGLKFKDINEKSRREGVSLDSMILEGLEFNDRYKRIDPYSARQPSHKSWIYMEAGGNEVATFDCVPISPESISESTNADYNSPSLIGRSAPVQIYTGTSSRSTTITFKVHYDLALERTAEGNNTKGRGGDNKRQEMKRQLASLRKGVYPKLISPGYVPVITHVCIGQFMMKGLCKNITYNWQQPFIDGELSVCEVSMQIDEILPKGFKGLDSIGTENPQRPFYV